MSPVSFVVRKSTTEDSFLKIVDGRVTWTQKDLANSYTSKYAAKRHMAFFSEIPASRVIVSMT